MKSVEIPVPLYEERYNDTLTALGKLTRIKFFGITCIWSPDAAVYCVPTIITIMIVFGVVFTLWNELGFFELSILCILLLTAFTSSFLVTCTDPGVYPRLGHGEIDPLQDDKELVYCRVCALRRPPRTSHCYQCNVCVLEHDHHCGILGGCVGQRSLRWFVLYLITVSSATSMGIFWLCRSLFTGSFAVAQRKRMAIGVNGNISMRNTGGKQNEVDEDAIKSVAIIGLFIVLLVVVMLVGSLAIFYVYLLLTSTTRRESKRAQTGAGALLRPIIMWNNLMHAFIPPNSMLVAPTNNINSSLV